MNKKYYEGLLKIKDYSIESHIKNHGSRKTYALGLLEGRRHEISNKLFEMTMFESTLIDKIRHRLRIRWLQLRNNAQTM